MIHVTTPPFKVRHILINNSKYYRMVWIYRISPVSVDCLYNWGDGYLYYLCILGLCGHLLGSYGRTVQVGGSGGILVLYD